MRKRERIWKGKVKARGEWEEREGMGMKGKVEMEAKRKGNNEAGRGFIRCFFVLPITAIRPC